ncbi:hypothetical protein DBR32_00200 [Taibaiella sp. KBW10]|uniref:hypothetical protein n=1 Tax=Taibaiella sp. KBW10 TaxID=2153357 RepID=UPI000F5B7144|nr:hypothetical protein [Taibaiella sp. KBW10]RQO32073.1 hypothetical protein DBR32_00200 [Taibaiella sp. KBW10]
MKKQLLRATVTLCGLGLLSLGFTSCIKDYTCRCEVVYSGKPGLPAPITKEYNVRDNSKGASSKCKAASQTKTEMGIVTTETCDLY